MKSWNWSVVPRRSHSDEETEESASRHWIRSRFTLIIFNVYFTCSTFLNRRHGGLRITLYMLAHRLPDFLTLFLDFIDSPGSADQKPNIFQHNWPPAARTLEARMTVVTKTRSNESYRQTAGDLQIAQHRSAHSMGLPPATQKDCPL